MIRTLVYCKEGNKKQLKSLVIDSRSILEEKLKKLISENTKPKDLAKIPEAINKIIHSKIISIN